MSNLVCLDVLAYTISPYAYNLQQAVRKLKNIQSDPIKFPFLKNDKVFTSLSL